MKYFRSISLEAQILQSTERFRRGPVFFSGKAGLVWPLAKKIRWNRLIQRISPRFGIQLLCLHPGGWRYSAGRARAYPFPGSFT